MIYKIIALVIIVMLLIADYAMLVAASRADDEAERMYKWWKDDRSSRKDVPQTERGESDEH